MHGGRGQINGTLGSARLVQIVVVENAIFSEGDLLLIVENEPFLAKLAFQDDHLATLLVDRPFVGRIGRGGRRWRSFLLLFLSSLVALDGAVEGRWQLGTSEKGWGVLFACIVRALDGTGCGAHRRTLEIDKRAGGVAGSPRKTVGHVILDESGRTLQLGSFDLRRVVWSFGAVNSLPVDSFEIFMSLNFVD